VARRGGGLRPRAGEVRGHRQLRQFIRRSQDRLARRHARIDTVAATCVPGRAVVKLLAHLNGDGREVDWPVAVVAESPDERSVVFRSYWSRCRATGRRRAPICCVGSCVAISVSARCRAQ
jgi:hypothetical protein